MTCYEPFKRLCGESVRSLIAAGGAGAVKQSLLSKEQS